jgi:hypothetical protein
LLNFPLQDLKKKTVSSHPDYDTLQTALTRMVQLILLILLTFILPKHSFNFCVTQIVAWTVD